MIMKSSALFVIALTLLLTNCNQSPNKFSDPRLVQIAEWQDHRLADSLVHFLHADNPVYRTAAALAFGSIQDSTASMALGNLLLEDSVAEVRISAAYALGQTGGVAAVNALIPSVHDRNPVVRRWALEALGKCVSKNDIDVLRLYPAEDSLSQEGLAWAFYRMALRKLEDSAIAVRQSEFLFKPHARATRFGAACYFDRAGFPKSLIGKVIDGALNDEFFEVRMACASALRKADARTASRVLKMILENDPDFRVRVNAARSLRVFAYEQVKDPLLLALSDSNKQVKVAASESAVAVNGIKDIRQRAHDEKDFRVQANLYNAIIKSGNDTSGVAAEVRRLYAASGNAYQKSLLLSIASRGTSSKEFLLEELIHAKDLVIKTAAAQALVDMNYRKDMNEKDLDEFVYVYKRAIEDGDPGVVGTVCSALADSAFNYRKRIKDVSFLHSARKRLHLPKDIESLQPLEDAIAYLEGRKAPDRLRNSFSHPIDWTLVKSIYKDQRVSIRTDHGEIVLRLLVDEAPGSVGNFVDLVQKKYYDGRYVHRVVPNFVMQTGCNRGDGFGSEDYAIRSEFSLRSYDTGSVGYASAGKDTEGTQWFITHCPTPHLDGRYSIFAVVEEGMTVVNQVSLGDKIISVNLIK